MKITKSVLSLLLAAVMLFSAVPVFAQSSAEEQAAAYNRHSIGMKGIHNARELGGYVTEDGKTVKFGKLLRTAKLADATDDDIERLEKVYHVKKDIDFRSAIERAANPDVEVNGMKMYSFPALGETMLPQYDLTDPSYQEDTQAMIRSLITLDKDGNFVNSYFKNTYRQLYTTKDGINAYKNFFHEILTANGDTVLWHCTSGKDRCGNASFLLLLALGVDQETAIQDFLNTNYYYEDDMEDAYETALKLTGNKKTAEDISYYPGVKREWIETSLKTIEQEYGSVDNYFHKALGLSDQDLASIRAAYLE